MNQARTGRAHVDFTGAALVENLDVVPKLSASDDGVFTEQYTLPVDQPFDRNQLHFSYQIAHFLVLRHEAARPGRRVFDERSKIGNPFLASIAKCMTNPRIGYAGHEIDLFFISPGESRTALVADPLHIDVLGV